MKTTNRLLAAIALSLFTLTGHAQQAVDFSKSFVNPSKSAIGTIQIGGISVQGSPAIYSVDFVLRPDYTLAISAGDVVTATQDAFEQSIRNTGWTGTYIVNNNQFTTTLTIFAAQNGYVGGEVIHQEINNRRGYLKARVAGEVVKQYYLNGTWTDQDQLSATQLQSIPSTASTQFLLRLKRVRGVSYIDDSFGNPWSVNREYRLALNNTQLSGTCSIPPDNFGSGGYSDTGTVTLTKQ